MVKRRTKTPLQYTATSAFALSSLALALACNPAASACIERGGHWGKHGYGNHHGCALRARDAGKSCHDNHECTSHLCLAEDGAHEGTPGTGRCFDCIGDCAFSGQQVEHGIVQGLMYVD